MQKPNHFFLSLQYKFHKVKLKIILQLTDVQSRHISLPPFSGFIKNYFQRLHGNQHLFSRRRSKRKGKKKSPKKISIIQINLCKLFNDFTRRSKYSVSIYDKGTPWLTRTWFRNKNGFDAVTRYQSRVLCRH